MSEKNPNDKPNEHVMKRIPLKHIHPNGYNPNSMSETEFKELVLEVQHLGRVAKPVVIRPDPDRDGEFRIVDGEHNYRAACEAGLEDVLCEIIEVDEVEARVQTYKRNQHGKHNRLREGLMFAEVIESDQISQRELAERLNVGEWKIRRAMKHVKAYRQHREYLESRSAEPLEESNVADLREFIAGRRPKEIEDYLQLPSIIRDEWLRALAPPFLSKKLHAADAVAAGEFEAALHRSAENRLAEAVFESAESFEFGECIGWLQEVDQWLQERTAVEGLTDYVRCCAAWRLSTEFLNLIPIRFSGRAGEVVIPVESWDEVLRHACGACDDPTERYALISNRIRDWLRANGIAPSEVATPRMAKLVSTLERAPAIVRDADFLTVQEQIELFLAVGVDLDEQQHRVLAVVLEHVEARRAEPASVEDGADDEDDASPASLYHTLIEELENQALVDDEDALFANVDEMRLFLKEWLDESEDLQERWIGERAATEVLMERLESLAEPELVLIRAAVAAETVVSIERRWLNAVVSEEDGSDQRAAG